MVLGGKLTSNPVFASSGSEPVVGDVSSLKTSKP